MRKLMTLVMAMALAGSQFVASSPVKADQGKVTVCHIPPGNPANAHSIIVSVNALPAHLAHGDTEGLCKDTTPPPDEECVANDEAEFTHTFEVSGGQAKASITLQGELPLCDPEEINLVVYKASGPTWNTSLPQTLNDVDASNTRMNPGETLQFQVPIPDCYYQVDFVFGPVIEDLSSNNLYGNRKVSASGRSTGPQSWINAGSQSCIPETQPEGPVCGNEDVESGEACDDGNKVNGDGCENDCTVTPLPPETQPETQPEDPVCGNGKVESGEVCDDDNQSNGDGCENDCTLTPENPPPADPVCGNGTKELGEACDDGNEINGDGCESDCTVTPDHNCEAVCGNGIKEEKEECDDGNLISGDGCENDCAATSQHDCEEPMPEVPHNPGPNSDPTIPTAQTPAPQIQTPNPAQVPSNDDLRRTAALVGSGGNAESAMGCSFDVSATAANSTGAWISLASLFTFLGVRRRISKK